MPSVLFTLGLFVVCVAGFVATGGEGIEAGDFARTRWWRDLPHETSCNCTEAVEVKAAFVTVFDGYKNLSGLVGRLTDALGECMELHKKRSELVTIMNWLIGMLLVWFAVSLRLLHEQRWAVAPAPPVKRD